MAQIGWTAHRILLDKFSHRTDLYEWYCVKTVSNRWSVRYLEDQVSLELHKRHSAAINNFSAVLEPADAEQALQATKDPYIFDYLDLAEDFTERQLEKALLNDIQKLLLELGVGFMFYGRQRPLFVGDQEFYPDLLFYHHTLRRFVVIELKVREFAVESVSKMNLYLNAIDEQLCTGDDKESVGIILCKSHNETVAKLALHRMSAPIAVSTWRQGADLPLSSLEITDEAPDDLKELDRVRTRLVNHVVRRTREILSAQGKSKP